MFENLDISTFTAHNIFVIKQTCLLIKCASLGTKEGVFIETMISFWCRFDFEFAVPCPGYMRVVVRHVLLH